MQKECFSYYDSLSFDCEICMSKDICLNVTYAKVKYQATNQINNKSINISESQLDFFDLRLYDIKELIKINNSIKLFTIQNEYTIMISYINCTCAELTTITARELNKLYSNQHNRIYKAVAFFVYNVIDICDNCKEERNLL